MRQPARLHPTPLHPNPFPQAAAALLLLFALCPLHLTAAAGVEAEAGGAPAAGTFPHDDCPEEAWPTAPWAGELGLPTPMGAVGGGSLLLKTAVPGLFLPAPALGTELEIRVTGPLARARLTQRFHNPTGYWVEGVYVFPLPENAAVDTLEMRIGSRVIAGEIQEREEAKRTYEEAKQEGRKASLVEQERPNLFTTSVANLGPGEEIEVSLELQQEVRYDQGVFELRFPLVVGVRYIPGRGPEGPAVPDAARIAPPVTHPSRGPVNPVRLRVELDPGFPLARLESPSHPLSVRPLSGGGQEIHLAPGEVPADRDFILVWEPEVGAAPRAALFTEDWQGETYALVMVLPPRPAEAAPLDLSREVVLVLDTSGSMGGTSIREAKSALLLALGTLGPQDLFNVIEFNSHSRKLFPASVEAESYNLEAAARWVRGLDAGGGTEMLSALRAALERPFATQGLGAAVRQVIFITDAGVGNEDELFHTIADHLGESRLFTVGIGSAPNSHFMTRAAELGRGTYTFIASPQEVEEKMVGLFAKLESPVLADLEVSWEDPAAEAWPARVPDLYLGEPLVVASRLGPGAGPVRVSGRLAEEPWQVTLPRRQGVSRPGVHRLWARRKIAARMTELATGADPAAVRASVVEVALVHGLVSQFTSLVAVDLTPTAPEGTVPVVRAIPLNLPAGWDWEKVFGPGFSPGGVLPQGATGARRDLFLALLLGAAALLLRRLGGTGPPQRPAASQGRKGGR